MEQLGFFSEDRVKLRSRKIVETVLNEDEEEVGSIRRKAFAGQTIKSKNISVTIKPAAASKKTAAKSSKKKTSHIKSASVKRTKIVKSRKLKERKRNKK
jgi:hypothetical protein